MKKNFLTKWWSGAERAERLAYLRGMRAARAAAAQRVGGIELPAEGRSSIESNLSTTINSYVGSLGGVSPVIDFGVLRCLKNLWCYNPDFSQYVANIVNLGNPGHQLMIDAATGARAEAALKRLNAAAARIYQNAAGVDGLINAYLAQVAWSGALSSEDVVDLAARRVEQVVIVPVEQIRFRYLEGEYRPFQQPGSLIEVTRQAAGTGLVELNPDTYHYYALQTIENSPYAKPPATAAMGILTGPQTDVVDNIKFIAKKLGILGMVSVSVTPPPRKDKEADNDYQARAKQYLASIRTVLDQNFNKGLLVTYRDQKVEHANVASDASGAYDIFRIIEEQAMSGLAMPPAFFGRTDSTTETYAEVVYHLLLAQIGNIQRLAKRRQEATYRLDLRLGGIDVAGLSVQFNRAEARNPFNQAQADQVRVQTAIEKVRAGFISADQAAQELGYDSAYDPNLLRDDPAAAVTFRSRNGAAGLSTAEPFNFRFDRAAQRYRFVCPALHLANDLNHATPRPAPLKIAAAN
ncbi:MAG: hypothetical protein ABIP75_11770 [Pyrinomonadaceae bacterium]